MACQRGPVQRFFITFERLEQFKEAMGIAEIILGGETRRAVQPTPGEFDQLRERHARARRQCARQNIAHAQAARRFARR